MIGKIAVLTSLSFSAIYPLCFWISSKNPLKNNFHHFHLGLPNVIGAVTVIFLFGGQIPAALKIIGLVWQVLLTATTAYYWKKETPHPLTITLVCLVGLFLFFNLQSYWVDVSVKLIVASLLGGMVFCSALFAMNLGHWYLNVHGLPIKHFTKATYVFWICVALRGIWDAIWLITGSTFYLGESIPMARFLTTLDGFLLIIGILFGTLFPLVTLYFVQEILKLKNTQAATGILYAILCAVVIGDITYKYYAIKFGIYL